MGQALKARQIWGHVALSSENPWRVGKGLGKRVGEGNGEGWGRGWGRVGEGWGRGGGGPLG